MTESPDARLGGRVFYGWIIVAAGTLMILANLGIRQAFSVFLKPVSGEFGWSRATISSVLSLNMAVYAVSCIVMGRLTDRFGPRVVVAGGAILTGLGLVLASRTGSIWHLFLTYSLMVGIGLGVVFPATNSGMVRWFKEKRGLALGIVNTGSGLGTLIIVPLANYLILSSGWRDAFVYLGLLLGLLLLAAASFMRRDPQEMGLLPYGEVVGQGPEKGQAADQPSAQKGVESGGGYTVALALRSGSFWALTGIHGFGALGLFMLFPHLVAHATDIGVSPTTGANIMATVGVSGIVGRIAIGSLSDRIGSRRGLVICLVPLSLIMVWLIYITDEKSLFIFAAILGIAYGGYIPLWIGLCGELFGSGSLGFLYGIVAFPSNIGVAIGPFLSGIIFDVTGSYDLAFGLAAGFFALSLVSLALVRTPPGGAFQRIS
ncbi:MAG: MFS transporter [Dehalococcoidia bacterium]